MTDERRALLELVEKQADGDLVREMLAFAAGRIMEMEVEARTGAASGERTAGPFHFICRGSPATLRLAPSSRQSGFRRWLSGERRARSMTS